MRRHMFAAVLFLSAFFSVAVAHTTQPLDQAALVYAKAYDLGRHLAESQESIKLSIVQKAMQDRLANRPTTKPPSALSAALHASQKRANERSQNLSLATPAPDRTALSYAYGYQIGQELSEVGGIVDQKMAIHALKAGFSGGQPLVSIARMNEAKEAAAERRNTQIAEWSAINKVKSDEFLNQYRRLPDTGTLPGNVYFRVLETGNGPIPNQFSDVQLEVHGPFPLGAKLEQQPSIVPSIKVSEVPLPGLREVLLSMPTGSHWETAIPAEMAYGVKPSGGFPPNTAIIFYIKLMRTDGITSNRSVQAPNARTFFAIRQEGILAKNKKLSDEFLSRYRSQHPTLVALEDEGVLVHVLQTGQGSVPTQTSSQTLEISGPFLLGKRTSNTAKVPVVVSGLTARNFDNKSVKGLSGLYETLFRLHPPAGSYWEMTLPNGLSPELIADGEYAGLAVQYEIRLTNVYTQEDRIRDQAAEDARKRQFRQDMINKISEAINEYNRSKYP